MYKIERKNGSFTLTFGGRIDKPEMERWVKDSEKELGFCHGAFGVIIDMRTLDPLRPDVQSVMVQGQALYRSKGMQRSAVILDNPVLTFQFMRLAKESGIYAFERYIDSSSDAGWQKRAEAWIISGVDPDK